MAKLIVNRNCILNLNLFWLSNSQWWFYTKFIHEQINFRTQSQHLILTGVAELSFTCTITKMCPTICCSLYNESFMTNSFYSYFKFRPVAHRFYPAYQSAVLCRAFLLPVHPHAILHLPYFVWFIHSFLHLNSMEMWSKKFGKCSVTQYLYGGQMWK